MPFGSYFDDYYAKAIKPAITDSGLKAIRGDEIYGAGVVLEDIYSQIKESSMLLADVTNKNPNVSYELGVAHALGKPVIIITQNEEDVPFDYKHIRHVKYDVKKVDWVDELKAIIKKNIEAILQAPSNHLAIKPDLTVNTISTNIELVEYGKYLDDALINSRSCILISSGADQIRTYIESISVNSQSYKGLSIELYLRQRTSALRLDENVERLQTMASELSIDLKVFECSWDMIMISAIIHSTTEAAVNFYTRNDKMTKRVWPKYIRIVRDRNGVDNALFSVLDRWFELCKCRYVSR